MTGRTGFAWTPIVVLVVVIAASACARGSEPRTEATPAEDPQGRVSGTIFYRERVALTPEAVVHVSLVDVSLADAPAEVIAEKTIREPGQVPIHFDLEYDPGRIDPRNRYAVQARITEADRLLFTTTTAYLVLTQGHPAELEVMVQSVPERPGADGAAGLVGSWTLESFGEGEAAEPASADNPPNLTLEASRRTSGSTGCNRLTGSYTVAEAGSLSFSPLATTRMACLDPSLAAQETRYLEALEETAGFSASQGRLRLTDGEGRVLLVFSEEGRDPAAGFANRVWRVRGSSGVAPGTLYVFLSEGTLVVTSPNDKPMLGTWKYENEALTMVEEGIPYRVDILDLRGDEFRIRSYNPGEPVDITLVPAEGTSVDK